MSSQTDIAQGLTALTAQVAKIGEESKVTIQKLADLETQINNAPVTPELQAAFDALKAQVTVVDDLIPDAAPPTEPTA